MGREICYQIKFHSKELNKSSFSTLNCRNKLNSWFLTGFSDAESCFSIKIQPNAKLKTKWRVRPVFSITLHLKDLAILEDIQNTLGVGKISKSGKKAVIYAVDSIKDIPVIINHFDKYPLITAKLSDYLIFKNCFEIIQRKEHLTKKGLLKLLGLKSSLNLGLPDNLKNSFTSEVSANIVPVDRPGYFFKGIPDPFWVSGFTSGDGSFHIVIKNSDSTKEVFARYAIHLHVREIDVLKGLATYFKLYNTEVSKTTKVTETDVKSKKITILDKSVNLQISKISDIVNIIIPFFEKYPILGMKSLDFEDFKKVCNIIKTKKHLTSDGFNEILEIKSRMNQNRKW